MKADKASRIMKADKTSIKWRLFTYLSAFVLIMVALLWLSQIIFLDSFYKTIKTQSIRSSAENIEDNINNSDLQTLVDKLSQQNELCIRIVDESGNDLYSAEASSECMIHRIPPKVINEYRRQAVKHGGTYLELVPQENPREQHYDDERFIGNVPQREEKQKLSMIYVKTISMNNTGNATLLLSSAITPVYATVDTLRVQLIVVTLLMLLLATGIAMVISRKISKPLIRMNHSAKRLAKGDYSADFAGKGYLEVYELGESLNYAANELSKTEKLRQELIANISHDLRTPLTMITGYAEAVRDLPGENTPENIQIIIDEARHLSNLVNDVLALSRLQTGIQALSITSFNLSQSITEILRRYSKLTGQDGYVINFEHDTDVVIEADEVKLSQVIYNLINNAVTYTGPDKLVTVSQKVAGGNVRIEITDTGEGISPENLPFIWDRYFKVDKSHKRAAIGSGIGLSIVKGILELHGAKFGVESSVGNGSTFWFELKLVNS